MAELIDIFTDGACRGNPGPGGWGAILRFENTEKYISGAEPVTTNNRMELTAAIEALKALKKSCTVNLTTDSQYVRKGITEWLPGWMARGWRTSSNQPVKNVDLWKALYAESQKHTIAWHWVRGHSGHPENEQADALANQAIDALMAKQ